MEQASAGHILSSSVFSAIQIILRPFHNLYRNKRIKDSGFPFCRTISRRDDHVAPL